MTNEYEVFLAAIRSWGTAPWMDQCFGLTKRLFTQLKLHAASPELGMTVGKTGQLNINIGSRWIICPWGDERVALIWPLAVDEVALGCEFVNYFTRNKAPEAKWVVYQWPTGTEFPEAIYHQWEQACTDELKRTKKTAYRKFHSDLFFDTVMNEELRQQVLIDAYKNENA